MTAYLTGAGEKKSSPNTLGQAKHVHGAQEAGLHRLYGVVPALTHPLLEGHHRHICEV